MTQFIKEARDFNRHFSKIQINDMPIAAEWDIQ